MSRSKAAQGQIKAISFIWLVFRQINLNEQEATGEGKSKLNESDVQVVLYNLIELNNPAKGINAGFYLAKEHQIMRTIDVL